MWKYIILILIIFMFVTEQKEYETSICLLKDIKIRDKDHWYTANYIGDLLDKHDNIIETNITIYMSNRGEMRFYDKLYTERWISYYDLNAKYACYYSFNYNNAYIDYSDFQDSLFPYIFGVTIQIGLTLCIIMIFEQIKYAK